jgi:hypothetical protein
LAIGSDVPSPTGTGASGTWGINVTGNAATAGGLTPSATAGVANRIVAADASGYIYNNYFSSTDNSASSGVTAIMVKVSDNFLRSGTAAAVATFISGQSMNIAGNAAGLSSTLAVASGGTGVTTASAIATLVGNLLFPVGAIYTATVATNPGTLLGFGTWTAFGAGRVLIGNGGGFSAGSTGGSADAVVVSHTHTANTSITDPGHFHTTAVNYAGGTTANGMFSNSNPSNPFSTNSATTGITASTSVTSSGVSGTNANLQPYIVVYMWQRTA